MVRGLIAGLVTGVLTFWLIHDPKMDRPHVIEKTVSPARVIYLNEVPQYTMAPVYTLELSDGALVDVSRSEYSHYKKGQSYP